MDFNAVRSDLWFVIASGPSLNLDDCELIRNWITEHGRGRVIVTNSTVFSVPWADVLYASDLGWWKHYTNKLNEMPYRGVRVSIAPVSRYGVHVIGSERSSGLGRYNIRTGRIAQRNSGAHAINLACLWGAQTVVLLGHDGKLGSNGEAHHFGDHPWPLGNAGSVDRWAEGYDLILSDMQARQIRAVNCSRETAHRWPRQPLEAFLEEESTRGQRP